jgi:hypothetical protein
VSRSTDSPGPGLQSGKKKRKNSIAIAVPLGEGSQQVKVLPKKSVMDTNYVGT